MKRLLFEVHRWGGIVMALFMTLWFSSGLLIVFAEPGTPTKAQQLAHSEILKPEANWLSAGVAWQRSSAQRKELAALSAQTAKPIQPDQSAKPAKPALDAAKPAEKGADKKSEPEYSHEIVEARLLLQAGEPIWLIEDDKGRRFALSAVDGKLHSTSSAQALEIAANWKINKDSQLHYVETLDKPAILRNQEGLRPFHRIAIEDGHGSELLISQRTGEVVHASTRFERGLYWAGNWIHLFRPLELTSLGESRVTILTWVSGIATVVALAGLVIGWLRWRPGFFGRKTYSEGRTQPYRNFWSRWHFWAGLIGGTLAFTWGLSGYLNNNPFQLFSPANPEKAEFARYLGGESKGLSLNWKPAPLTAETGEVVELSWRRLGDDTVQQAFGRDGQTVPVNAEFSGNFSEITLHSAIQRLGGKPIARQSLINEYDRYYYLRHHRDVADRPLPVLRVELADAHSTTLYINPQDGRLLAKQDNSRRVFRWLYSALHHWDFGFLYQRPLWDSWMVVWVLFGWVLSVSSVVLGYRRLKATFRPHRNKNASSELVTQNQAS
jgi:uncharacterized iron-regulated membrane protein